MITMAKNVKDYELTKYIIADARNFLPKEEIHLVVTSPPYYNYVNYQNKNGLENSVSYKSYLLSLKSF